jgi:hypothetical protein
VYFRLGHESLFVDKGGADGSDDQTDEKKGNDPDSS